MQRSGSTSAARRRHLDAEPVDPPSSSGHRDADELRPTVVVLKAATQPKAARTVATFGGARRCGNW